MSAMTGRPAALFGAGVAFVTSDELRDDTEPWPEELQALGAVADRRRWDFVAGRRCARQCLQVLGHPPTPVLIGARREPVWPPGVVGSITHTASFAAAVVAPSTALLGVGLDAEPDETLPSGVLERITTPRELQLLELIDRIELRNPERLLFSVKEATFKVWYPLTRRWLDFDDVSIEVDPPSRRVVVEMLVDGPFARLEGTYSIIDGLIIVGIELRRPAS